MKFMLNSKDIITLNQQFEDGSLHNEASLDFALNYARKTENWTKAGLNFTVDKSIASSFQKLCRKKGYNMSAKVEQAMSEMLKKDGD